MVTKYKIFLLLLLKNFFLLLLGVIGGIPVPFPLPDPDACKMNVKCPVASGDSNVASFAIPVLTSYPSISLYIKIELKADDQNQDYTCLEFPATIVSSAQKNRKLVNWAKGKLFDMLN